MKFIHLSDIHFLAGSISNHEIDPSMRLDAAVNSICRHFSDAEFCMLTGDLADKGEAEAYRDVKAILDRLPFPWHPLMGNHDNRSQARTEIGDLPWHKDGFLQYDLENDVGHFIAIDSVHEGVAEGRLCEKRLNWLKTRLDAARDAAQDVYLFMHHVPFDIGIDWIDNIKMVNGDDLAKVLGAYENIRHLFMGHVHRPCHGSWNGIPFSTVRATPHQVNLLVGETGNRFIKENPSYAVVLIEENQVVIHDHSFLEEDG
jgi:Icc protein